METFKTPGAHLQKLFLGTDSCAGIGATGRSQLFHGKLTDVNYVIEGMRAGEDALIPVKSSGVISAVAILRESGKECLLLMGGTLLCGADDVTTTVASSSQVAHLFKTSSGKLGGQFHTADPDNAFIQLPGNNSIAISVNSDGAFGCVIEPLRADDPRRTSLPQFLLSKDEVYSPPQSYGSRIPVQINREICHLLRQAVVSDTTLPPPVPRENFGCDPGTHMAQETTVHHLPDRLLDEDEADHTTAEVTDLMSGPAMGTYTYITPLTHSLEDLGILQVNESTE